MANFTTQSPAQAYSIKRSNRAKHARITISPTGKVVVVVPNGVNESFIPDFVSGNQAWIEKKLLQLRKDHDPAIDSDAPTRIFLRALDEQWHINYTVSQTVPALDQGTAVQGNATQNHTASQRVLTLNDTATSKAELLRWLNGRAREVLVPWVRNVSQETGLVANAITIRGQKTRWGSCTAKKNLSLNRSLLFLPPALVRYLIIHELCHTVFLNHSRAYWQLVEQYEPDYRVLDKSLSSATQFVPRWAMPG